MTGEDVVSVRPFKRRDVVSVRALEHSEEEIVYESDEGSTAVLRLKLQIAPAAGKSRTHPGYEKDASRLREALGQAFISFEGSEGPDQHIEAVSLDRATGSIDYRANPAPASWDEMWSVARHCLVAPTTPLDGRPVLLFIGVHRPQYRRQSANETLGISAQTFWPWRDSGFDTANLFATAGFHRSTDDETVRAIQYRPELSLQGPSVRSTNIPWVSLVVMVLSALALGGVLFAALQGFPPLGVATLATLALSLFFTSAAASQNL